MRHRDAAAFGRFCDWLAELYDAPRCRTSSTATSTPRSTSSDRSRRRWSSSASAPSAGSTRASAATSTTSACGGSSPSSRCTPGLAPYEALAVYAVITYMDTRRRRGVPDGGMHALPVALRRRGGGGRREFHYDTRVERILLRDGAAGRVDRRRARRRRAARRPTSWSPTPTCRSRTAPCCRDCDAPRAARRGTVLAVAVVWCAGVRGAPAARSRAPQHPLRPRVGPAPSRR